VIRSRTCRKNPPHSGPEGRIRVSVDYNPYDPATIENPYPAYQRLREEAGVHHLEELGLWAVPRYDDVLHVLRDPKLFSSEDGWGTIFKQVLGRDYIYGQGEGRNIIATDPPVHSRIRRTVNRAFTPKLVQSWGQGIRSVASGLLDDLEAKAQDGPVDIVEEYFSLLPVTVISMILGIPSERREEFKQWAADILSAQSPLVDPEVVAAAGQAVGEYFAPVVEQRRANPGDDIVSLLVQNGADGEDPLTFYEMVGFATVLLLGGTDTTGYQLSNWLAQFIARPELAAEVRADRTKVTASIEESFRYDPIIQMVFRAPTEDVTIGGVAVPKGSLLAVMLGSANRDESVWGPDAGEFRIGRETGRNLVFGSGPHVCLGAHLARLEMRLSIDALLDRFSSIEPAAPPARSPNFNSRGLTSMPVKLEVNQRIPV